ncbi:MAG TPA: hypothetical protein VK914_07900 [bacterium]|nr:hypothetical protein [bacterium]
MALSIPAWGALDLGSADQNVQQQQDDMTNFFNDLARGKPVLSIRRAAATVRRIKPRLPENMWQEGLEDPCKRAAALNAAKALAGSGLASVGSSMAGPMSTMLSQTAAQMIATGDAQFMSVGESLQQESAAIGTNNQEAAQTAADQVNATDMPDVSGYAPTTGDVTYTNAVSSATSQVIGSVLTAVGTVAGGVIGAYTSFGGGTAIGAMYGASLGSLAGNAIGSAVQGTQPDNSGLESAALADGSQLAQSAAMKALTPSPSQSGNASSQNGGTGAVNAAPSGNGTISGSTTSGNNTGALGGASNL